MKHVHGCMQAHQFVGQQDPTQEPLHFVLHASGSEDCQKHSIPLLPTGNLVSGQPAAVVSYCQVGPLLLNFLVFSNVCLHDDVKYIVLN